SSAIQGLQLALYLENLEVNLFRSAEANITNDDIADGISKMTLEAIKDAAMQEQVHQTTLQNLLVAAGAPVVPECRYLFPSRNTTEFLSLGRGLSSVGVSATLALVQSIADLDPVLTAGIASIATTEARHDSFFNAANSRVPNPAPFDTPISPTWAYNLALKFVVQASCPTDLPFPILPILTAPEAIRANQTHMRFSWDPAQRPITQEHGRNLFIGWVNQLGPPIYTSLSSTGNGTGITSIP
ncbi:ferritin-like domain-containing protein, partial [Xylogone sp. PMI_703]